MNKKNIFMLVFGFFFAVILFVASGCGGESQVKTQTDSTPTGPQGQKGQTGKPTIRTPTGPQGPKGQTGKPTITFEKVAKKYFNYNNLKDSFLNLNRNKFRFDGYSEAYLNFDRNIKSPEMQKQENKIFTENNFEQIINSIYNGT